MVFPTFFQRRPSAATVIPFKANHTDESESHIKEKKKKRKVRYSRDWYGNYEMGHNYTLMTSFITETSGAYTTSRFSRQYQQHFPLISGTIRELQGREKNIQKFSSLSLLLFFYLAFWRNSSKRKRKTERVRTATRIGRLIEEREARR